MHDSTPRRWERGAGRAATALGLSFGACYLLWRARSTLGQAPPWLEAAALAIEVVGALAVVILAWAIWPTPASAPRTSTTGVRTVLLDGRTEVVVRCCGQECHSVEATLLAARDVGPVLIVDLDHRDDLARLAARHRARYVAAAPGHDERDRSGLGLALRSGDTPYVLVLDAGDVPSIDIVAALCPDLDDPDVALVQGILVAAHDDSAEHGPTGRDDLEFEQRSLNPSLGRRGVAVFTGSGALVRRSAALASGVFDEPGIESADLIVAAEVVQARLTAALFSAGWRITAPGGPAVVAAEPLDSLMLVEDRRAREASGARTLLVGAHGALRPGRLGGRQRLAMLAWSIRPLAGVRRLTVLAIVLASLFLGSVPFRPDARMLVVLWMPWFVLSAVGLGLLSSWTLRPGDRIRHSMRNLGTAWRGLLAPLGPQPRTGRDLGSLLGVGHGLAAMLSLGVMGVVLALRGLSDRFTHTLGPLRSDLVAALVAVTLWMLAGTLDVLRLLARRAQARRANRVAASLPSIFADQAALIVDLTPLGAAVISDRDVAVGTEVVVETVLPTSTGLTTAVLRAVIRNAQRDFTGDIRYGIEFLDVDDHVSRSLVEYAILQPARAVLGEGVRSFGDIGSRTVLVDEAAAPVPRRLGLRLTALVAVTGAVAAVAPGTVEATATMNLSGTIAAVTDVRGAPLAGVEILGICADRPGGDGIYGTSDDHFRAPVRTTTADDGSYRLRVDGPACWVVAGDATVVVADLRSGIAPPTGVPSPSTGQSFPPSSDSVGDGPPRRLFPRPSPDDLGAASDRSLLVASVVTVIAALLGMSVLLGFVDVGTPASVGRRSGRRPRHGGEPDPDGPIDDGQSASPDFAMR